MTKYLLIAIALLTLALGGAGYALKREIGHSAQLSLQVSAAQEALRIAQARSVSDRKVSAARASAIASERRKSVKAQADLNAALQANKSWAATQVPTEVLNALTARSSASGTQPLSGGRPDGPSAPPQPLDVVRGVRPEADPAPGEGSNPSGVAAGLPNP